MMGERYWIAINGSSCALSSIPWRNPVTVPAAQQMFGFPTFEEAREAQRTCLHEPIDDVQAYLQGLLPDIQSGRVAYKRSASAGPQTRGQTAWMEEDGSGDMAPAIRAVKAREERSRLRILPGLPGAKALPEACPINEV
jgi:hypothetical protein